MMIIFRVKKHINNNAYIVPTENNTNCLVMLLSWALTHN